MAPSPYPLAQLRADRLACRRGGRMVFSELSFSLESGQALLLTGANGTGKSSLLRLLATLLAPAEGSLQWQGVAVDADIDAYRAGLRFVSHQDAVKPVLTVRENLAFLAGLGDPALSAARIEAALEAFDMAPLVDLPARLLSAGQRRRLALSRLVAAPAPLWLLDEPGSGLDRTSLQRLHGLIAAHRARGGLVIASSHGDLDLPGAAALDMNALRVAA
jgi:heme exporter protein A